MKKPKSLTQKKDKPVLDMAQVVILETSDMHCQIFPFDYLNDKDINHYGFSKTSSLIEKMREKFPHSILVDNGDLLQGSLLGAHIAHSSLYQKKTHPLIQAMNFLKYDLATPGNHDFNYGLEFLQKAAQEAQFPFICSNLFSRDKQKTIFPASHIITQKSVQGRDIKIGFVGVLPPQILIWDKPHLEGKVCLEDMVVSVRKHAKLLKKQGVDLVVVLAHSGILPLKHESMGENEVYAITKIKHVDVVLSGHAHGVFPGGKAFDGLQTQGLDNQKGTINGKPVLMPGAWGAFLGVCELHLLWKKQWILERCKVSVLPVEEHSPHLGVLQISEEAHQKTILENRSVVGTSKVHFHSWFAPIMPTLGIQFVQDVSEDFVKWQLKNTPYANFPIVSVCSPVNAGSHGAPYVDIRPGDLTLRDVVNLYPFENQVTALKLNLRQIVDWIEFSAQRFLKIPLQSNKECLLVERTFPSFNMDNFSNLKYKIDVTKPFGKRVFDLSYFGEKLSHRTEFIVVTNSFRAFGGGYFPHLNGKNIVFDGSCFYKELLLAFLQKKKDLDFSLRKNWSLVAPKNLKSKVIFETAPESLGFEPAFLTPLGLNNQSGKMRYQVRFL